MKLSKLKITESGRIVEAAQWDNGYGDWLAMLPYGSKSEAKEMPRAVLAGKLFEAAPELLGLLREAQALLEETRDYGEFCDHAGAILAPLDEIDVQIKGVAR